MALDLIWKAPGLSSGQALSDFKQGLGLGRGREGIGHTGTLDPFAEGLLLVGTGEGTKILAPLMGLPKTYRAEIILGLTTNTLDPEGEATKAPPEVLIDIGRRMEKGDFSAARLEAFLAQKMGPFLQTPPAFSALKIEGKRAYDLARKGVEVELKPRPAEIRRVQHLEGPVPTDFHGQSVWIWTIEVAVSSGTYIRCLARDWGLELAGHPGCLRTLVRTEVGPFHGERPTAGSGLVRRLGPADLQGLLPTLEISPSEAEALQRGGLWRRPPSSETSGKLLMCGGRAQAFTDPTGALGRVFRGDPFAAPESRIRG